MVTLKPFGIIYHNKIFPGNKVTLKPCEFYVLINNEVIQESNPFPSNFPEDCINIVSFVLNNNNITTNS